MNANADIAPDQKSNYGKSEQGNRDPLIQVKPKDRTLD